MTALPPLTAQQVADLAQPAPRYTSYPAVPRWKNDVDSAQLQQAIADEAEPVAVYVHVPFCWKDCFYCGCNRVISRRQTAGERYLAAMARQIEAMPQRRLARLHLGGGTPTWLAPEQLVVLFDMIRTRFTPIREAEFSIEVHPGVTSTDHLDRLQIEGFHRISVGVQSTDPKVLAAIGRIQTQSQVDDVVHGARQRGFSGVNLDLVYGLPYQDHGTLERTLDAVVALRPDRLALYGYAHVPWIRANQRRIEESALPDTVLRAELSQHASERLVDAGWLPLGLDHFALPTDSLAAAASAGRLSRDFMGYTDRASPLVGLGPSAISEIGGLYAQQPPHLGEWYTAVEGGDVLPVERGHRLTADDALRRAAIRELMCHLRVPGPLPDGVETQLARWSAVGAVELDDGLQVTERGRPFLNNVAACFDATTSAAAWRVDPG